MSDPSGRGSKLFSRKQKPADQPESVMAMAAPRVSRDNPLTRSVAGMIGLVVLLVLVLGCLGSVPWTFGSAESPRRASVVDGTLIPPRLGTAPRYNHGDLDATLLPPSWWSHEDEDREKIEFVATRRATESIRQALLDQYNQTRVTQFILENPDRTNLSPEQILELRLIVGELPGEIQVPEPTPEQISRQRPFHLFGTDNQGRDVFVRTLAGGAISIGIGLAAATLSVFIGTLYGALAGYIGGSVDACMMRVVDILYGLPYILLVVLLAVAGEAMVDRYDNSIRVESGAQRYSWILAEAAALAQRDGIVLDETVRTDLREPPLSATPAELDRYEAADGALNLLRASNTDSPQTRRLLRTIYSHQNNYDPIEAEALARVGGDQDHLSRLSSRATEEQQLQIRSLSAAQKTTLDVLILLIAIGGVSWLTMARVIRGQVLSLKSQPFMEAARSIGTPIRKQFRWHLLPNLLGPIIVYATLTVPQAVLQESFLSFLGIGVQAPLPSWGNLAAQGLNELNTIRSRWWLLFFPCLMLGVTLLALNFVGEGLREAFDPKRARK
jgi:ABC-type dipeptide/oligopeptide/nickel transport system permease subunit